MKYIDIHSHLNFPDYENDLAEVISRAQKAEVGMIIVGTDCPMSEKAVKIAEGYKDIWATIAIHPTHTKDVVDFSILEKLAKQTKVVAIGECGLDYFRGEETEFEKQKKIFIKHIDLANEVNKPLMLHIRSGNDRSAYKDAHEIIRSNSKVLGDIHFFAGNAEEAKLFLDLGFYFSFTGVITFARNYDEVIKYIPIDRIMSETDCPYVTPAPHRGKRNEPVFVTEIANTIAMIKGLPLEKTHEQLVFNAVKMFSLTSI